MSPPVPVLSAPAFVRTVARSLLHDYLLWILLLALAALTATTPAAIGSYTGLVDWPTMATLTGLLILTKGVELSGLLHRVASELIGRMRSQRALALVLVGVTALLATVLTNDVALFVMVPLTLTLGAATNDASGENAAPEPVSAGIPVTRMIIFEALAANAGSALTPIGNPQNLYLWQQSQQSFAHFTWAMLPLTLQLTAPLLLLTACVFSGRAKPVPPVHVATVLDRPLLLTCLALYLPLLLLAELHHAPAALGAIMLVFLARYRQVLARLDWALLLVFILMFIDLRLVANIGAVQAWFARADLAVASHLYLAAIAASQLISNVPATILLAQYTHDWRLLAFGVNVGGAGLAIGSLASIIALRMAPQRRAWLVFHAYSIPYLLLTGALAYAWIIWRAAAP